MFPGAFQGSWYFLHGKIIGGRRCRSYFGCPSGSWSNPKQQHRNFIEGYQKKCQYPQHTHMDTQRIKRKKRKMRKLPQSSFLDGVHPSRNGVTMMGWIGSCWLFSQPLEIFPSPFALQFLTLSICSYTDRSNLIDDYLKS